MENNNEKIGSTLKPVLVIVENAIWNFEADGGGLPGFDDDSFRAIIKLFTTALIERIWSLQERENMDDEERVKMGLSAAAEVKKLVKVYANIDTMDLYKHLYEK